MLKEGFFSTVLKKEKKPNQKQQLWLAASQLQPKKIVAWSKIISALKDLNDYFPSDWKSKKAVSTRIKGSLDRLNFLLPILINALQGEKLDVAKNKALPEGGKSVDLFDFKPYSAAGAKCFSFVWGMSRGCKLWGRWRITICQTKISNLKVCIFSKWRANFFSTSKSR